MVKTVSMCRKPHYLTRYYRWTNPTDEVEDEIWKEQVEENDVKIRRNENNEDDEEEDKKIRR